MDEVTLLDYYYYDIKYRYFNLIRYYELSDVENLILIFFFLLQVM